MRTTFLYYLAIRLKLKVTNDYFLSIFFLQQLCRESYVVKNMTKLSSRHSEHLKFYVKKCIPKKTGVVQHKSKLIFSLSPCWVTCVCCAWLCCGLQGSALSPQGHTAGSSPTKPSPHLLSRLLKTRWYSQLSVEAHPCHSSHPRLRSKCEASPGPMKPCLKTKLKKQIPYSYP